MVIPGVYKIVVVGYSGSDGGIVTVYMDSTNTGTFDEYGGAGYNTFYQITGITISSGSHTVKFKVTSKNGSSSSYRFALHGFFLIRTGA